VSKNPFSPIGLGLRLCSYGVASPQTGRMRKNESLNPIWVFITNWFLTTIQRCKIAYSFGFTSVGTARSPSQQWTCPQWQSGQGPISVSSTGGSPTNWALRTAVPLPLQVGQIMAHRINVLGWGGAIRGSAPGKLMSFPTILPHYRRFRFVPVVKKCDKRVRA
jgi:hypothetical protein